MKGSLFERQRVWGFLILLVRLSSKEKSDKQGQIKNAARKLVEAEVGAKAIISDRR